MAIWPRFISWRRQLELICGSRARLRAEVVGGIARVILFEEGLREVQPGEMLVTPITTAGWTCIFSIISAVVTNIGAF